MQKASGSLNIVTTAGQWARIVRRDVLALWLAARDRRVPWYAKAVAGAVAAYALSPIDLIPDFIPVLGYLDDLVIVPLGILLAVKLVPNHLMAEFRAEAMRRDRPASRAGLVAVLVLWIVAAGLLALAGVAGLTSNTRRRARNRLTSRGICGGTKS